MISKCLKRFNLKPNSHQRDYIEILQTNECYIIPFFSVTNIMNIMRKGQAYVRLGWLHWYVEYFKDHVLFSGCDEEECIGNINSMTRQKKRKLQMGNLKGTIDMTNN